MNFEFRKFRELDAISKIEPTKRQKAKNCDGDELAILEFPPTNAYLTKEIETKENLMNEKKNLEIEIDALKSEIAKLQRKADAAEIRNKIIEKNEKEFANETKQNKSDDREIESVPEINRRIVQKQRESAELESIITLIRKETSGTYLSKLKVEVEVAKKEYFSLKQNLNFLEEENEKTKRKIQVVSNKLGLDFIFENKERIKRLKEKLIFRKNENDALKNEISVCKELLNKSADIETLLIEQNLLEERLKYAKNRYKNSCNKLIELMNGEEDVVVTRDVKVKSKPRALRTTFIIDTPPKRNNFYTPMKTGYVATRNINDEDMKFLTTNQVKKLDEGVNNVQPEKNDSNDHERKENVQKVPKKTEPKESKKSIDEESKKEKEKEASKQQIEANTFDIPEQEEKQPETFNEKKPKVDENKEEKQPKTAAEEKPKVDENKEEKQLDTFEEEKPKIDEKKEEKQHETVEEEKPKVDENKEEKQHETFNEEKPKVDENKEENVSVRKPFVSSRKTISIYGAKDVDAIEKEASKFGNVVSIVEKNGFVEVAFSTHEEASSCLINLNGREIGKFFVSIKWSSSQTMFAQPKEPEKTQQLKEETKEDEKDKNSDQDKTDFAEIKGVSLSSKSSTAVIPKEKLVIAPSSKTDSQQPSALLATDTKHETNMYTTFEEESSSSPIVFDDESDDLSFDSDETKEKGETLNEDEIIESSSGVEVIDVTENTGPAVEQKKVATDDDSDTDTDDFF